MARQLNLVAALLKLDDSTSHVPDSWRSELLRKHLDDETRTAVARTCRAGLHWCLQDSEDATLRVPLWAAAYQRTAQLLRSLHAARPTLAARGGKPWTLAIVQRGVIPQDESRWQTVITVLGPDVPSLSLTLQRVPQARLCFAGQALPGLRSLSLGAYYDGEGEVALPRPGEQ